MSVPTLYFILNVVLVFLAVFVTAFIYMTRNFTHWRKKGVTEIPPIPFFGNFLDCCLFRASSAMQVRSFYTKGEGLPYIGFYIFDKPALLLRDPELIKRVLIKDFNYFINRYVSTTESDTIGSANMFLLKHPMWRGVRNKTSPIFTSGKLKGMFPLMEVVGNGLATHLDALRLQCNDREIDLKDICTKYTTDVITSCAFGLQVDSLNDPDSEFQKYSIKVFGFTTYRRSAEFLVFFFLPKLAELLRLKFFSEEASDFMRKIFTEIMDLRMENNMHRNDLIDLLIQLKKSQSQIHDPDNLKFDGDNLVGQAATFFAAGSETTASTISFALYELALNPDVQSELREELLAAVAENEGKITYEMVMSLPYLDMVLSETLRKYPPLSFLDRVASCDYKVPGTDILIEKGTPVYISILGLHYDPEHFPEPEKYDPQRFSKENKRKIPACVYLPFGEGPRNCIGLRFGLLVAKLGVFKFIQNYEVSKSPHTPQIPVRFDPRGFFLQPIGGMFLHVRKIGTVMEN